MRVRTDTTSTLLLFTDCLGYFWRFSDLSGRLSGFIWKGDVSFSGPQQLHQFHVACRLEPQR